MTPDDLQGFGPDARRAVASAEAEARQLGHDRVGTEHLLLGLLSDEGSGAAQVLTAAGASLSAARHKVREAVGPTPAAVGGGDGGLDLSARGARALGRARRFSHARRSPVVTSEHLLEGVLDVEGRAGQVLRGLGLDVDGVRAVLAGAGGADADVAAVAAEPVVRVAPPATCPSCHAGIDANLVWHTVTATSADGVTVRDALVFSCGACGETLGVAPA